MTDENNAEGDQNNSQYDEDHSKEADQGSGTAFYGPDWVAGSPCGG